MHRANRVARQLAAVWPQAVSARLHEPTAPCPTTPASVGFRMRTSLSPRRAPAGSYRPPPTLIRPIRTAAAVLSGSSRRDGQRQLMAKSGFTRSSALPPANAADSFLAMRSDGRRTGDDASPTYAAVNSSPRSGRTQCRRGASEVRVYARPAAQCPRSRRNARGRAQAHRPTAPAPLRLVTARRRCRPPGDGARPVRDEAEVGPPARAAHLMPVLGAQFAAAQPEPQAAGATAGRGGSVYVRIRFITVRYCLNRLPVL